MRKIYVIVDINSCYKYDILYDHYVKYMISSYIYI